MELKPKKRRVLLLLLLDHCHAGRWADAARERKLTDVVVQARSFVATLTFRPPPTHTHVLDWSHTGLSQTGCIS